MKHFKFIEMIRSSKANECGIDNWPKDADIMDNIIVLMENLDIIREAYGKPLFISSGYRCPELNNKVGGVKTSQHMNGQAADINCGSVEKNREFFNWLVNHKDEFEIDQLIDESKFRWVHYSVKREGNRKQILHL